MTSPAATSTLEIIPINYDPKNDFLDTGLDLISGVSTIRITASGLVNINWPSYPNDNGPDGITEAPLDQATNLPVAALIGKIGVNGSYFLIGSSYNTTTVNQSGRLYVGIYDSQRPDNSGSFSISIEYTNASLNPPTPTPTPTPTLTQTPTPTQEISNCFESWPVDSPFVLATIINQNGNSIQGVDFPWSPRAPNSGWFSNLKVGKRYDGYFFELYEYPCGSCTSPRPIESLGFSVGDLVTISNAENGWTVEDGESYTTRLVLNGQYKISNISNGTHYLICVDDIVPTPTPTPTLTPTPTPTDEPSCDNTSIDVSIPGSILRSGNYTSIVFRVGGPDCCDSNAPNMWSNEVTVAIPPLPPPPTEPIIPSICELDISGYDIHCNYDAGACGGGHVCNRALFEVYVNDVYAFESNLNNGSNPGNVYTNGTVPSNIIAQDYRGNGLEYKIEVRAHASNPSPHLGIAQIVIYDLTGTEIFNACVPNSQVVYVPAGQNCPTPTPTPTPTLTPTPTSTPTLTLPPTSTSTPTPTSTLPTTQSSPLWVIGFILGLRPESNRDPSLFPQYGSIRYYATSNSQDPPISGWSTGGVSYGSNPAPSLNQTFCDVSVGFSSPVVASASTITQIAPTDSIAHKILALEEVVASLNETSSQVGYEVSGAGDANSNGTYCIGGTLNGRNFYVSSNNAYLYYVTAISQNPNPDPTSTPTPTPTPRSGFSAPTLFQKTDFGTEVDIIIPGELEITRDHAESIYNSAAEQGYEYDFPPQGSPSPANTEWSVGWSGECNLAAKIFRRLHVTLNYQIGANIVGTELIMRHVPTGRIWFITFSSWTRGSDGGGGGFAYERREFYGCVETTPTPTPTATSTPPAIINNLFDKSSWANVVPQPYLGYLDQAADRWAQYIKYNPSVAAAITSDDPTWNGLKLESSSDYTEENNSSSGTIAACYIVGAWDLVLESASVQLNSTSFGLIINKYYENEFSSTDWVNILTHELGHALGIGILWSPSLAANGAVPPSNNFLSGSAYANCQAAYNSITSNNNYVQVPLESTGSSGTASAHWEDDFRPSSATGSGGLGHFGLTNELMVGYYSAGMNFLISDLSIKVLVDFGYQEVNPGLNEGVPTLDAGSSLVTQQNSIKLNCGCNKPINILGKIIKLGDEFVVAKSPKLALNSNDLEFNINIGSNDWLDTNIQISKNSKLIINASGDSYWNLPEISLATPDGILNANSQVNHTDCCICSNLPYMALIGQIGDGPEFLVGSELIDFARDSGKLKLRVNNKCPKTIVGSYKIKVSVQNYVSVSS